MNTMNHDMKIVFAGTPIFADVILHALIAAKYNIVCVYTQPDKPAGRGQKLSGSPVKYTALKHNIPLMQPSTLRDSTAQTQLASFNADVMIVAAYGLILPQTVLDIPRLGCINVHASILPRWRGAAPIQRAILAGDTETGITIMQMEAGLDTGPMLYKLTCPIHANDTSSVLHERLAALGAKTLLQCLPLFQAGKLIAEKQNDALACYANKLTKEESKLDWQQPAELLARQICAFNPWPVAYCTLHDQLLRIWQARVLPQTHDEQPGTIIQANNQGIDIAAGSGTLRLLTLQLAGQKIVSAAEMLNGRAELFAIGYCLA